MQSIVKIATTCLIFLFASNSTHLVARHQNQIKTVFENVAIAASFALLVKFEESIAPFTTETA